MGLQLIFVVETNKKCKSDWIYIKETIDRFFQYDQTQVKLSSVYMDGKGNYRRKEKEISSLISQYKASNKTNQSNVIFCFDCDDYDSKREDTVFLANAANYCKESGYDLIWFCKDVERVFLGKKVDDSQKKTESANFKTKKKIETIESSKLCVEKFKPNTSNIILILDKYLHRK